MTNRDVAGNWVGICPPFSGDGIVAARPILVRETSKGRIPGTEFLSLELAGNDQPMRNGPGHEPAFELGREIATRSARPVLLDVGKEILVRRTKERGCDLPRQGDVSLPTIPQSRPASRRLRLLSSVSA